MFGNGSQQNEHFLERTFHRCFLPSFSSFCWGFSEKIQMWKVNGLQTTDDGRRTSSDGKSSHCLWHGELKNFFMIIITVKIWIIAINVSVPARNWKWKGTTLEKGHFSASKTMKKGNTCIVIFSYLILKMSFQLCIKFNAFTWLIVYIFYYICTEIQLKSEDQ
jgi:hypothetical protein